MLALRLAANWPLCAVASTVGGGACPTVAVIQPVKSAVSKPPLTITFGPAQGVGVAVSVGVPCTGGAPAGGRAAELAAGGWGCAARLELLLPSQSSARRARSTQSPPRQIRRSMGSSFLRPAEKEPYQGRPT